MASHDQYLDRRHDEHLILSTIQIACKSLGDCGNALFQNDNCDRRAG